LAEKTLWELAELLIVPLALAVIGFWFTTQQDARQAETEEQRADDAALQAYLDQMSQLLLAKDRPLRQSEEGDEVQILARARTLTVLARLDPNRKAHVMQFLVEADLVQGDLDKDPIISLEGANLSYVDLSAAGPGAASPTPEPIPAAPAADPTQQFQLPPQALLPAQAQSGGAFPVGADLRGATLSDATLRGAILSEADLREADLRGAKLENATLSGANLEGARGVTDDQLAAASSLQGTTMPDGQILKSDDNPDGSTFEEWRKSKDRDEDGENPGPS
jgi:pentapeptide repeat protein